MLKLLGIALALLVGASASPAARAVPIRQDVTMPFDSLDDSEQCLEAAPWSAHVPVVDADDPITIGLSVVLDRGVDEARARRAVAVANRAYQPWGMRLVVAEVRQAKFQGVDPDDIIEQAWRLFPDLRPAGIDAVAVLTTVDLVGGAAGNAVAGKADCIGSVKRRWSGSFVAEVRESDDPYLVTGPVTWVGNQVPKIIAHELAHVFGAHHHYASCAEGATSETAEVEASPCTLMFNDLSLISLQLGTVEGSVVRGYADRWARP